MENEDIIDTVNNLLNPKEDPVKGEINTLKKVFKKLLIEDLKGKGFEFTGNFSLEVKDDTVIVRATKD